MITLCIAFYIAKVCLYLHSGVGTNWDNYVWHNLQLNRDRCELTALSNEVLARDQGRRVVRNCYFTYAVNSVYCIMPSVAWWRHQMETFSASLVHCAGNSPVAQRPVKPSFDILFDLHPNKRLSKQSWGWWFETPSYYLVLIAHVVIFNGALILCMVYKSIN